MIRPRNEKESLLPSITKNCETLINQTHTKAEEALEFKTTKPKETFHFNPPVEVKEDWMNGSTSLEVYNSILKKKTQIISSNFTNFLMKKVQVFHMKKSEMRLKETWIFRVLQLPIYKMK